MSAFIRVVVADDSPFICRLLTEYLESDPDIRVIQTALNGKDAVEYVKTLKPDVLTLDLNMPVLSGLDTLRRIMTESPVSVVLITGISKEAARMTEEGLSLGATDFIFKYSPDSAIQPESLCREIIAKVRAAARVKVIRSIPSVKSRLTYFNPDEIISGSLTEFGEQRNLNKDKNPYKISESKIKIPDSIVIVGASTGGPLALKELLCSLQKNFSFPLVIVQHIPEKFTKILADQLNRILPFSVKEAKQDDILLPGTVLVAPGDRHLLIQSDGRVHLSMTPPVNGHRPSIDVTMQSAARSFGAYTAGVLLSGMGNDGTRGLAAIKNNSGLTYVQSKETCVIDTMPSSAIKQDIVQYIGSPAEIGSCLMKEKRLKGEKQNLCFTLEKGK